MNKKAAIGLSVNTMVVVIISLVVLTGGIRLLYGFIGSAEGMIGDLDSKTESELNRLLLDEGKRVALPFNSKQVYRGENAIFGLGILNIEKQQNFKIDIIPEAAYDSDGNAITDIDSISAWVQYNTDPISIDENEHQTEGISISIPKDAIKGQYIFRVNVYKEDNSPYENVKKMYVTII